MISAIVTSVIEPTNKGYCAFTARERLMQTVFTVSNLTVQIPGIKIYIIDASLFNYKESFKDYPNVDFIHLASELPELSKNILTSVKSRGECMLLSAAFDLRPDILNSKYIIKISGRYFFENLYSDLFNDHNLDKFIFVRHHTDRRSWIDDNGYDFTGLRLDGSEFRYVLTSIIYGIGQKEFNFYRQMLRSCIHKIDNECFYYDIENLLYFHLREHDLQGRILATNWIIRGWNGENCKYMNIH